MNADVSYSLMVAWNMLPTGDPIAPNLGDVICVTSSCTNATVTFVSTKFPVTAILLLIDGFPQFCPSASLVGEHGGVGVSSFSIGGYGDFMAICCLPSIMVQVTTSSP